MKSLILIALFISTSCVMYGQGQIARPKKTVPVKTAPIKADSKKSKANSRQKQQKSENVPVESIGLDSLQDQVVIPQSEPEVVLSPEEMYAKGKEAAESHRYGDAIEWYTKAAEQDNVIAQYALGEIYSGWLPKENVRFDSDIEGSQNWPPNYEEAIKWFLLGAEQGDLGCQLGLGKIFSGYDIEDINAETIIWGINDLSSQSEFDKFENQYRNWKYRRQNKFKNYYDYWENSKVKNYEEALKWYRKAAEQGNMYAQNRVGCMYRLGQGITQPYSCLEWYQIAVEYGYPGYTYKLGNAYFAGNGVERDYSEAFKWLQKAAEQGNPFAKTDLGYLYYTGMGVAKDQNKARELWEDAANESEAAKEYLNKYFK